MSIWQRLLAAWRWFVDLCSAWPWLRPACSFAFGCGMSVYSYLEKLPGPLIALVGLLSAGGLLWIWNLLSVRSLIAISGRSALSSGEPPKTTATDNELAAKTIVNRRFRLVDVPRDQGMIHGIVFEDCHIEGPAVVFLGGVTIEAAIFCCPQNNFNALTIEVAEGRLLVGIIGIDSCILRRCKFDGISFCGNRAKMAQLRAAMQDCLTRNQAP